MEENKCGRTGRSGEGWKPKSERRLEEKKTMRERRMTGERMEKVRGEDEKDPSRIVQFDDRSRHLNQQQTEDLLRSLFFLQIAKKDEKK